MAARRRLELAEAIECVRTLRIGLDDLPIGLLGAREMAGFVQLGGAFQRLGDGSDIQLVAGIAAVPGAENCADDAALFRAE